MAMELRNGRMVPIDAQGNEVPAEKRWMKFVTEEEYWSLPACGREILEWRAEWMPKTCQRMKDEGTLLKFLEDAGVEMFHFLADNWWTMGEAGAREIMREKYMDYRQAEV